MKTNKQRQKPELDHYTKPGRKKSKQKDESYCCLECGQSFHKRPRKCGNCGSDNIIKE